jgi:hypothetical protein
MLRFLFPINKTITFILKPVHLILFVLLCYVLCCFDFNFNLQAFRVFTIEPDQSLDLLNKFLSWYVIIFGGSLTAFAIQFIKKFEECEDEIDYNVQTYLFKNSWVIKAMSFTSANVVSLVLINLIVFHTNNCVIKNDLIIMEQYMFIALIFIIMKIVLDLSKSFNKNNFIEVQKNEIKRSLRSEQGLKLLEEKVIKAYEKNDYNFLSRAFTVFLEEEKTCVN